MTDEKRPPTVRGIERWPGWYGRWYPRTNYTRRHYATKVREMFWADEEKTLPWLEPQEGK